MKRELRMRRSRIARHLLIGVYPRCLALQLLVIDSTLLVDEGLALVITGAGPAPATCSYLLLRSHVIIIGWRTALRRTILPPTRINWRPAHHLDNIRVHSSINTI